VRVRSNVEAAAAELHTVAKKAEAESVAKLTQEVLAAAAEAQEEGTGVLVLPLTLEGAAEDGDNDEASAKKSAKKLQKLQTKLLKSVQKKAPGLAFLGLILVPHPNQEGRCSCHCFAVVPKDVAKETGLDASAWVLETLHDHGGNGGGRGPIGMAQAKDIVVSDISHAGKLAMALAAKARAAAADGVA
jgi:hypothetical protein